MDIIKRIVFLTILHLLLSIGTGYSQSSLSGKIVDVQTQEPVLFAHISAEKRLIGISDQKGNFTISYSENQEIKISCIGYQDLVFTTGSIEKLDNNLFKITPKSKILQEVEVKAGKVRTSGHTKKNARTTSGNSFGGNAEKPSSYLALAHSFTVKKNPSKILTFSVFLKKANPPEYIMNYTRLDSLSGVRLRFVSTIEDGKIGEDLVAKNLTYMIKPDSGWYEFDLATENIVIEKKTFYVVLEFYANSTKRNESGVWKRHVKTPYFYLEQLGHSYYIIGNFDTDKRFSSKEGSTSNGKNSCLKMKIEYQ